MFEEFKEGCRTSDDWEKGGGHLMPEGMARLRLKMWLEEIEDAKRRQQERDKLLMSMELLLDEGGWFENPRFIDPEEIPEDYITPEQRRREYYKMLREHDRQLWEAVIEYARVTSSHNNDILRDIYEYEDGSGPFDYPIQLIPGGIEVPSSLYDPKCRARQRWIDDRIWEQRTFERHYGLAKTPIFRIGLPEPLYTVKYCETFRYLGKTRGFLRHPFTDRDVDDYIIETNPDGLHIFF